MRWERWHSELSKVIFLEDILPYKRIMAICHLSITQHFLVLYIICRGFVVC
jgi:hypothetical protein